MENLGDYRQGFEGIEWAARSKLLVTLRDGVKSSRFVGRRGRCGAFAPGFRLSGRVVIEMSKNNQSPSGGGERDCGAWRDRRHEVQPSKRRGQFLQEVLEFLRRVARFLSDVPGRSRQACVFFQPSASIRLKGVP
jgi:hypothetical protein